MQLLVLGPVGLRGRDGSFWPVDASNCGRVLSGLAWAASRSERSRSSITSIELSELVGVPVGSIYNAIGTIRRLTPTEVIPRDQGPGYRLGASVTIDRLELSRMAARVERGEITQPVDARHALEAVEQLWRGPPWVELDGCDGVVEDAQIALLDRRIIQTRFCELCSSIYPDTVLRVVGQLLSDAPDERLSLARARALVATGQEADALIAVHDAREAAHVRGVDLGWELTRFERSLLDRAPTGSARPASAPVPAAVQPDLFVGRRSEIDQIRRQAAAATGSFRACLIEGPSGIGKTWLAARATADRAGRRYTAACYEHGSKPLAPIVDAIDQATGDRIEELVTYHSRGGTAGLEPLGGEGQMAEAQACFKALAGLLAELAPVILVVDDLQWADEASCGVLERLIGRRPDGLFLLALARSEPTASAPYRALRSLICRQDTLLPLQGLSPADHAELAARHRLDVDDAGVRQLVAATGGSPLLASLNLHHLAANRLGLDSAGRSLSDELEALVTGQLEAAEETTRELVRWLAVAERSQSIQDLSAVCEARSPVSPAADPPLLAAAEQAVRLGLAREVTVDRFELSHTTLRTSVINQLSQTRQVVMHRRLADRLRRRPGVTPWAEVAFHAVRAGDTASAVEATLIAVRTAVDRFAPRDAIPLIEAVLAALGDGPESVEHRLKLMILGIEAAAWSMDPARLERFASDALALSRRYGLMAHAAQTLLTRAGDWQQGTFDASVVADIEETLGALDPGDTALRALLEANLSGLLAVSGVASGAAQGAAAVERAGSALELARRSGDGKALQAALQARIVALWSTRGYEEQVELATRLMELGGDQPGPQALGLRWRTIPRLCLGDIDGFDADHQLLKRRAIDCAGRGTLLAGYARQWDAMRLLLDGGWNEAVDAASDVLDTLGTNSNLGLGALSQLAWLGFETGQVDGLPEEIERQAAATPGLTVLGVYAAYGWAWTGMPDRARDQLVEVMKGAPASLPRDITWTSIVAGIAEIAALCRDRDLASELRTALHPWHGTLVCVSGGLWSMGAAERSSALFELTLNRPERAVELLERAHALELRAGLPAVARRTRAWLVRAGAGDPGALRRELVATGQLGLLPLLDG